MYITAAFNSDCDVPAVGEASVLVMVPEGVPEPQAHLHTVHRVPRVLQNLNIKQHGVA